MTELLILLRKEFFQLRWILLVFLLIFLLSGALIVIGLSYLQSFTETPEKWSQTGIPGGEDIARQLQDFDYYLWSQWSNKSLYQTGLIFVLVLGALQFAGEKTKKTFAFLLTRPQSRGQIYLGKFLAGFSSLFVIFGSSTVLIVFLSSLYGYEADWGRFLGATVITFFWLLGIYMLGLIISIKAGNTLRAGGGTGIIIFFFILLERTGLYFLSPVYYMRASEYFLEGINFGINLFSAVLLSIILGIVGVYLLKKEKNPAGW